jgi:hypothetical protein
MSLNATEKKAPAAPSSHCRTFCLSVTITNVPNKLQEGQMRKIYALIVAGSLTFAISPWFVLLVYAGDGHGGP